MTDLTRSQKLAAHSLQVQYLSEDDIPFALELIAFIKNSGCLAHPYHLKDRDPAELMQLVEDEYPLLGIKNFKGKLISFATVSKNPDDDSFIIRSLCTSPAYKGYGCAGKMMDAALAWIKENGGKQATAKVASDNQVSLSLFENAGFTKNAPQLDEQDNYEYHMMSIKVANYAPKQECGLSPAFKMPEYL